jgi:pimeloyl-ACP methyl ester carboxylesterase
VIRRPPGAARGARGLRPKAHRRPSRMGRPVALRGYLRRVVRPRSVFLERPLEAFGRRPAETVRWHCRVSGRGPAVLLAFHGFSQTGDWFDPLAEPLRGTAELWAVDLPAHGRSDWPTDTRRPRACTPADLAGLLDAVRAESGKPVTLLGFSMGGRYAAALATVAADRLEALHLAAPEALRTNWGQRLGTRTAAGRWLLRRQIARPGLLLDPLGWMQRRGLVRRKMADFVRANLASEALRAQLHHTWHAMHGLPADPPALARAANAAGLPVQLWLGRRDMLVRLSDARRLAARLDRGTLTVLDRGHFVCAAPGFARGLVEGWPAPGEADRRGGKSANL